MRKQQRLSRQHLLPLQLQASLRQHLPPPQLQASPRASRRRRSAQTAQVEVDPPPLSRFRRAIVTSPRGRRDPFVNPIPKPAGGETVTRPLIRPDGLPGVLVSEVKLSGIIYSPQATMKKAILVVGRSTYFAGQGDSLFDGVVREIPSERGCVFDGLHDDEAAGES